EGLSTGVIATEHRGVLLDQHCRIGGVSTAGLRHSPRLVLSTGGALAHVRVAGLYPDRAVNDTVHNRVGVDVTAEARVPVFLRVLSAEHCRDLVIASLEKLEQHPAESFAGFIEEPLVDDE